MPRRKIGLAKLRKLADKSDGIVTITRPVSDEELVEREKDYQQLSPDEFAKKYRNSWYRPVTIMFKGKVHQIQLNRCTDPFCKWFGMPQERFTEARNKPSRYKLTGTMRSAHKFVCNPDPLRSTSGTTWDCTTVVLSNWSIAEEIARLAKNDKVRQVEPTYNFHHEDCENYGITPFDSPSHFYRKGKTKVNTQRWQCKSCKKLTNILPTRRESFNYHQQRNNILLPLANDLLSRTPIKRTCEVLGISPTTYYSKLEWLYYCCLEFLNRHEAKAFEAKKFDTIWLNTDQMYYYLNNVRKRGHGGLRYNGLEDKLFQIRILVSADQFSRYVFRSDIAFDWDVSLSDIEADTKKYKDDHLNDYARSNAHFPNYSSCPQLPTQFDTQTESEYLTELSEFIRRKTYVDGLQVNSTYTSIAQLWLIKQMVHSKNWRFITDEDHSIKTAINRVFAKEICLMDAHHFLCKIDDKKSLKDAFLEAEEARRDLKSWGIESGYDNVSMWELARLKLEQIFRTHQFHKMVLVDGREYPTWAKNPVEHPRPSRDQGIRLVDCTTNVSTYSPVELALMVLNVNNSSTNAFMQQIRRRISFLERPLMTARGDGKSYIYANFNPRYAQYALTILRTYYNFCKTYRLPDKTLVTPAQRLGLTDKQFTLKDIIYFS